MAEWRGLPDLGTAEPSSAGSREPPPYPLDNARSDKLDQWPWRAVQRQRCLIPARGFWEPEKLARAKGVAPRSYYRMVDGRPFFVTGLWSEVQAPTTGEVGDAYSAAAEPLSRRKPYPVASWSICREP